MCHMNVAWPIFRGDTDQIAHHSVKFAICSAVGQKRAILRGGNAHAECRWLLGRLAYSSSLHSSRTQLVEHPLAIVFSHHADDTSPQPKLRESASSDGRSASNFFAEFLGEEFLAGTRPGFKAAHHQIVEKIADNQNIQWTLGVHGAAAAGVGLNGHSRSARAFHR